MQNLSFGEHRPRCSPAGTYLSGTHQSIPHILNISHWLLEVCKHFLAGLYSGGLIFRGPIFWGLIFEGAYIRRVIGLTDDLYMPKNSPFCVQSQRLLTTFNTKKLQKRTKVNTEALYMFCSCPFIIQGASERYLNQLTGGLYSGGLIFGTFTYFRVQLYKEGTPTLLSKEELITHSTS